MRRKSNSSVRTDGEPVTEANRERYRELFTVVFTDSHLFPELLGGDDLDRAHADEPAGQTRHEAEVHDQEHARVGDRRGRERIDLDLRLVHVGLGQDLLNPRDFRGIGTGEVNVLSGLRLGDELIEQLPWPAAY